jgi:hypothetical protein
MDAHGRVMSISATLECWTETIALPLGGLTLAALGVRAGALALAGVALAAELTGLAVVTVHPPRAPTTPVTQASDSAE